MDRSAVTKWIDKNKDTIILEFGLSHWKINIECHALQPDDNGAISAMKVKTLPEYERAQILVNFDAIPNDAALDEHLRHELMHILHAPFDLLWQALKDIIPAEQHSLLGTLYTQAEERTVLNLERFYEAVRKDRER